MNEQETANSKSVDILSTSDKFDYNYRWRFLCPGLGSCKDANARIIITIKNSLRVATRESIKIVPSRSEGCVYECVFDFLGRQIQMTSEMHVTISAAQQGGCTTFAHLTSFFLIRTRFSLPKDDEDEDSWREKKEEITVYCIVCS